MGEGWAAKRRRRRRVGRHTVDYGSKEYSLIRAKRGVATSSETESIVHVFEQTLHACKSPHVIRYKHATLNRRHAHQRSTFQNLLYAGRVT